jgi:hypothetical protein
MKLYKRIGYAYPNSPLADQYNNGKELYTVDVVRANGLLEERMSMHTTKEAAKRALLNVPYPEHKVISHS